MKYILVILMTNGSVATAEFNDKLSCIVAASQIKIEAIENHMSAPRFVCSEKGHE